MKTRTSVLGLLLASLGVGLALMGAAFAPGGSRAAGGPTKAAAGRACAMTAWAPDGPQYYRIELVPTESLPGLGRTSGGAQVSYSASPFGPSIAPNGSYVLDLALDIDQLPPAPHGAYVAWVSTPTLGKVKRLGALAEDHRLEGQTDWNQFLVIVTLEETPSPAAERWRGPVVLRGISRSGMMHTMAGHGPFASEPCPKYGY